MFPGRANERPGGGPTPERLEQTRFLAVEGLQRPLRHHNIPYWVASRLRQIAGVQQEEGLPGAVEPMRAAPETPIEERLRAPRGLKILVNLVFRRLRRKIGSFFIR